LRGDNFRLENRREIQVKRNFLTRSYVLSLKKKLCNGCGTCVEVCIKDAIEEKPVKVVDGRLKKIPTIDFNVDSCILCGECAVLCPLNALEMEVDGEKISTIVKNEAFPVLLKGIEINREKCNPECELICQVECPTKAITVSTKKSEDGKILQITDVQCRESLCIYCKRCELICPFEAIQVRKPFHGTIELDSNLCPEGCMACADICPTHTIHFDNGKPIVDLEFCVFCSACQKVCPEKAISVKRKWISHSDIKAAAWLTALKKITSLETLTRELHNKSVRKRTSRIRDIKGYSSSK
jgi:4Fe-4S ferredoxin